METIEIYGLTFLLDRERTTAILEANDWRDWCQCDGCTNSRVTNRHFLPLEVVEKLERVGIDAHHPFHREGKRGSPKDAGKIWSVAYWPIIGKVLGETRRVELSPDLILRIEGSFTTSYSARLILEDTSIDREENLLFLKVEFAIPWIVDELCELRYESHRPPCPSCSHTWRWTAYLKRNSRVPAWYERPEMEAAFRRPKTRVLVEICLDCGALTYVVVPDKPPFRRKSVAAKEERRRRKLLEKARRIMAAS